MVAASIIKVIAAINHVNTTIVPVAFSVSRRWRVERAHVAEGVV
jgi:hypothetical protein